MWDISRVRGLDGQEVGHVWDISRVRGLDGLDGHVCGRGWSCVWGHI